MNHGCHGQINTRQPDAVHIAIDRPDTSWHYNELEGVLYFHNHNKGFFILPVQSQQMFIGEMVVAVFADLHY